MSLSCILLAYGTYALTRAHYDVFPEFAPPQVGIQTEAPGLTPEQVEILVTRPIENAINGAAGVQKLRSTSIQGLSVVTVFFDPSGDIYRDRQVVAERLAAAAQQLPQGVQSPVMTPLTSSTSRMLVVGLTSQTRSLMDLRTAADWTVRLRLLAVPGVASVTVHLPYQICPGRDGAWQAEGSIMWTTGRSPPWFTSMVPITLTFFFGRSTAGDGRTRRGLHRHEEPAGCVPDRGAVAHARRHCAHGAAESGSSERQAGERRSRG